MYPNLKQFYADLHAELGAEVIKSLSAPFLLSETAEYKTAPKKLLYIGQETHGWGEFSKYSKSPSGAKILQEEYEKFDFAEGHSAKNSPFWRFHRALADRLGQHYRTILWANLIKVDRKNAQTGSASILWQDYSSFILSKQRGMLSNEIKALKPDGIIFVTGHNYDQVIIREFPDLVFRKIHKDFEIHQFAALDLFGDGTLVAFRTYHPAYLQRSRLFDPVLEILGDKIGS